MTKKKKKKYIYIYIYICKCFTNTSDNPQGDSNKKDIIDFNIDKVIKELNDSLKGAL